jgi:hypothetical protein
MGKARAKRAALERHHKTMGRSINGAITFFAFKYSGGGARMLAG